MIESYFKYYKKAFRLLNQNIIIYLIDLLIVFGRNLSSILSVFGFRVGWWITVPFTLLFIGFLFTPVKIFNDALQKKPVTVFSIFQTIRKLFFKTLLYFLMFIIMIFLFIFISSILVRLAIHQRIPKEFWFYAIITPVVLLAPALSYFGIYFAIENKSFSSSIKSSVAFTIKHLSFSYLIFPYLGLVSLISLILNKYHINNGIFYYIYTAVVYYAGLIIQATFLLYYSDRKKSLV